MDSLAWIIVDGTLKDCFFFWRGMLQKFCRQFIFDILDIVLQQWVSGQEGDITGKLSLLFLSHPY